MGAPDSIAAFLLNQVCAPEDATTLSVSIGSRSLAIPLGGGLADLPVAHVRISTAPFPLSLSPLSFLLSGSF